jgi:hypothetical protein
MNEQLKTKMNHLMYSLTKDAAIDSFEEYLEDLDISMDEYQEIKDVWERIGINKTYI